MPVPLEIVAAALITADPPPIVFLSRQGFEADATYLGVGRYRLRLSDLAAVDPLSSCVLVTPAIGGCLFEATLIDDRTVSLAFTDAAGADKEAQFSVAVVRVTIP